MASSPTRPPIPSYGLSGRVKNAFRPVIDGDEIRAAAVVTSGPPPYTLIWLSAAGAVPLSALISGLGTSGTVWGNGLGAIVPGMCAVVPAALMQRMMLIAVTDGQLLVAKWSTLRRRASSISIVPAGIVTVRVRRRRNTTTIVMEGHGTGPIRLHAVKRHRAELDQVLAAAYAAGTVVTEAAAV